MKAMKATLMFGCALCLYLGVVAAFGVAGACDAVAAKWRACGR